jgi:hypothetical protein
MLIVKGRQSSTGFQIIICEMKSNGINLKMSSGCCMIIRK